MRGEVTLRKWRVTLADSRTHDVLAYDRDHAARRALRECQCAPVAIELLN
jgi:hypothetical protein